MCSLCAPIHVANRGRGDSTTGFRLEALDRLVERIAEVVERERLQHQTDGVGLVAQRCGARREGALARGATPELHDLEFLFADTFAADSVATAVRALCRLLVRVRSASWSEGRAGHKRWCPLSLS